MINGDSKLKESSALSEIRFKRARWISSDANENAEASTEPKVTGAAKALHLLLRAA